MAMNGINLPLGFTAQEAMWQKVSFQVYLIIAVFYFMFYITIGFDIVLLCMLFF